MVKEHLGFEWPSQLNQGNFSTDFKNTGLFPTFAGSKLKSTI